MRILLTCEHFLPSIGGVELHTEILAKTLLKQQNEVTVYCFKKYKSRHEIAGVNIVYHRDFFELLKLVYYSDIIISNGELSIKSVFYSMMFLKTNYCFYHMALNYIKPIKKNTDYFKNILRRILVQYPKGHIAVSNAVVQALGLPLRSRKYMVINPLREEVEHAYASNNEQKELCYDIIYCGRIIEGKGIFTLKDALNKLEYEYKMKLNILLVGEGDALSDFKNQLSPSVSLTIHPFTDAMTLVGLYQQSKIMILPSSSHQEGSGLVLIEFMQSNKPVIVSDQKALIETIADCGLIFEQGNAAQLAIAIKTLLTDGQLYKELSEKIKIYKKQFDLDNFERSIKNIIK